jgi:hypothetical protein
MRVKFGAEPKRAACAQLPVAAFSSSETLEKLPERSSGTGTSATGVAGSASVPEVHLPRRPSLFIAVFRQHPQCGLGNGFLHCPRKEFVC